jgi:CheY-like chemotaxis protein
MTGAVLLVDDDHDHRESLRTILEGEGFPVFEAENGQLAMELLPTLTGVRLVLVDLHMPVMDGRTLIKRIKDFAARNRLAIAVCSSEDGEPPSGIIDFIHKPVAVSKVIALAREHCE